MTRSLPLASVVLLVAVVPCAFAQETESESVVIVEDPEGDTGGPFGDASGRTASLDITSVTVLEAPSEFLFRLTLASLDADALLPMAEGALYEIHFQYGGVAYQIQVVRGGSLAGSLQATLLWDRAAGSDYEPAADLTAAIDPTAAALVVPVPRNVLLDQSGAPAFAGQAMTSFWAQARSLASPGALAGQAPLQDRAPDAAVSATAFPIRFGVVQQGSARLSSQDPFRASNGEATTFRYRAIAENLGSETDRFLLSAADAPLGWTIHLPQPELELAGQATQEIEILADVPFAHAHGRFATFAVILESMTDEASVGRILLGVLYTEPAQPAGHHPTLTLHSRADPGIARTMVAGLGSAAGGVDAYMNTWDDDPADAGLEVPPAYEQVAAVDTASTFTWLVQLRPGLAIGLDMDLAKAGSAQIPFVATAPLPGATLSGSLRIASVNATVEPGMGAMIAELVATAPVDIGAGESTPLSAVVQALQAGDYVPHKPGQDLWLELVLSYQRPDAATGPATPRLKTGGTIDLPLLEYRDEAATSDPAGDSTAPGDQRAGNDAPGRDAPAPGAAMLFLGLLLAVAWRSRR